MRPNHNPSHPTDPLGLPEGLLAAVVCAGLLIGSFALTSASTTMPPGERWAALTTFGLLATAYTLPGCAALYDALGRAVRRDWRALATLAALVPALYLAYSLAVGRFEPLGLISAALFAGLPAAALLRGADERSPTAVDAVGLGYLWLSLQLGLLPALGLPEQGALVGFFQLAAPPLLLLLLAARGWPGLGFTWFLSPADLRAALLASLALALALGGLVWALGMLAEPPSIPGGGGALVGAAVAAYFFTALPAELLLRGVAQNGVARALAARGVAWPGPLGLLAGAALAALAALLSPGGWRAALIAGVAALGYGWVFLRTGKVTASAVPHMFVALLLMPFV